MKSKKMFTMIAAMVLIFAFGATALAADYHDFYFAFSDDSEDDAHGLQGSPYYKEFTGMRARIECDTYTHADYNWKGSVYYTPNNVRATEYAWLNAIENEALDYLSGYGAASGQYNLWGRRDDREEEYRSYASGDWRP